jgi:hypothetical protein
MNRVQASSSEISGIVPLPNSFTSDLTSNHSVAERKKPIGPSYTFKHGGVEFTRTPGWRTSSASNQLRKRSNSEPHFWLEEEILEGKERSRLGCVQEALDRGYPLIEHGLVVVLHKKFDILHRVWSLSEGQDKLFKILTSFCRILGHCLALGVDRYHSFKAPGLDFISRLKKLQSSTSLTRKFLKLFNSAIFIKLILQVWTQQKFSFLKILVLGRFFGLLCYFGGNYIVWAIKTGLLRFASLPVTIYALRGYVFSIVCTYALDAVCLFKTHKDISRLQAALAPSSPKLSQEQLRSLFEQGGLEEHRERVESELRKCMKLRAQIQQNFVKNTIDGVSALDIVCNWGFSPLVVGFLGGLSSLLALDRLWSRQSKLVSERREGLISALKSALRHEVRSREQNSWPRSRNGSSRNSRDESLHERPASRHAYRSDSCTASPIRTSSLACSEPPSPLAVPIGEVGDRQGARTFGSFSSPSTSPSSRTDLAESSARMQGQGGKGHGLPRLFHPSEFRGRMWHAGGPNKRTTSRHGFPGSSPPVTPRRPRLHRSAAVKSGNIGNSKFSSKRNSLS